MAIKKLTTIKVITILLFLFCVTPNIMGQRGKNIIKGGEALIEKEAAGRVLSKGKTRNATSIAAQRYGNAIANTNASKRPSTQTAPVPHIKASIKEANKPITPPIPPEIKFPATPINRNKVIDYKSLSSEWDKKWMNLIEHEIERVYHLVPKKIQKEEYKLKIRSTENKTGFVYINHSRYDKDFQLSA